ncbi:MAG: ABC transporter ATP-binding protein [Deltaproteobacteria bacterium GWB2_55_19]|nr:MAG: ABC transporter ATP-binding protein [Deltaproteobacteria bacterium GWB2_55_19]
MIALKLLIRNAFRHKLRTYLTILGMTVAILAFGLLRTVVDAWYAGVEASAADRLITRNSISLVFSLPISYKEKIKAVDGVEEVASGNWFAGVYISEKNFFANFAVEPRTFLDVYPEYILSPGEKTAVLKDRKAAVIGVKLAERFGWKVGDPVTLRGTIFPGDWDFTIRGIYRGRAPDTDESQFFFHWDYLNERVKETEPLRADQAGFFFIKIADPDRAAEIAVEIDSIFRNSLAETLTETERAFQMGFVSMTEAIMTAIQLVSFVVIVIIMAVMANTMAMSVRERMGEYAVFKTLGFGPLFITALILGESFVITTAGGALGVLLTYPAAGYFKSELGEFFPVFIVKTSTIYMDIGAAVIVAVVAAVIPSYRAATVSIIDALRKTG